MKNLLLAYLRSTTCGLMQSFRVSLPAVLLGIALLMSTTSCFAEIKIHALALFKNKAVLEIDGKRRTVKAGNTTDEGVKLISSNSNGAKIEVNGETLDLKLNSRISTGFSSKPKLAIQLYPGRGGHYYVDGLINGHKVSMLVDTGATTIAINRNLAKSMGLLYRVDGKKGIAVTASGHVESYDVIFRTVTIRGITLTNVRGTVLDGNFPTMALLGQSYLNRLNLRREGIMMELRER